MEVKRDNVDVNVEELVLRGIRNHYRLRDLVRELAEYLGVSEGEAVERVYSMYKESKIDITPSAKDIVDYFKTSTAKKYILVSITSIICLILVNIDVLHILRVASGLLLLFYLPGYALIKESGINVSSGFEEIVLSITLSITILLFVGLILNYSPWGLRVLPLTTVLTIITISLITATLIRDFKRISREAM